MTDSKHAAVWKYFKPLDGMDDVECYLCGTRFPNKSSSIFLRNHLVMKHSLKCDELTSLQQMESLGSRGDIESDMYKVMLRDLIKHQIQVLVDQLTSTGVESVLLTASSESGLVTEDGSNVGSDFGLMFLQSSPSAKLQFQDFCSHYKIKEMNQNNDMPHAKNRKRSSGEINGQDSQSFKQLFPYKESSPKRSRSLSPQIKTEPHSENEDSSHQGHSVKVTDSTSLEARGTSVTNMNVPKGLVKCCVCNYMSKFRANVTRHERSKHGFHIDGTSSSPSVQYACSICVYKSPYRSNLIRHEKSVHKVFKSSVEYDSRKHVTQSTEEFCDMKPFQYLSQYMDQSENCEESSCERVSYDHMSFVCSICEEIFTSSENLRLHMNTDHIKENNFLCDKCNQAFSDIVEFNTHMITHNSSKQEVCDCGKMFQYRTSLLRHKLKCEKLKTSQNLSYEEGLENIPNDNGVLIAKSEQVEGDLRNTKNLIESSNGAKFDQS